MQVDPIELEFGYGIIPLADVNQGGDLLDRVVMIRRQIALELGTVVPIIRLRDNIQLNPNQYIIKIKGIQYARKGSTIILVAVFAGMAKIDLAVLNDHELDLNTSMMYRNEDYVEAIRLVNEGKVTLKPLISKHFAFQDYLKAYEYIDENRESTMKVIIDIQK